ncbi:MAG: hypothetical protein RBQ97_10865 [Acholeplasma sp.]|nr:hypothetical protein [Acholeplasma sp.]
MTIKKYILLNNNKIYDLQNEKDIKAYKIVKNSNHVDLQVKKTSDNILDLVEVEDLIGCYYEKKSSDGETWIETPIYYVNGISETHYHLPVFSIEKDDKHIKAIYKLQPNGDYKRYEVIS